MKISTTIQWEKLKRHHSREEHEWIRWQEYEIRKEFEKEYIVTVREGVVYGEDLEDKYYTAYFEIIAECLNHSIVQHIQNLLVLFQRHEISTGYFKLVDDCCFNPKILYFNQGFKLSALGFCSMKRDYPTFSYRQPNENWRKCEVEFEFDKPNMVIVELVNEETESRNNKSFNNVITYNLKVHKLTITRIVVDQKRIYLQLLTPVVIQKSKCSEKNYKNGKQRMRFERTLQIGRGSDKSWFTESDWFCVELNENSVGDETFYNILSRFHFRAEIPIEFHFFNHQDEFVKGIPYNNWSPDGPTDVDDVIFSRFLKSVFVTENIYQESGRNKGADKMKERRFSYVYLIETLLARGAFVKNQLLLKQRDWITFLKVIRDHFNDDEGHNLCESALEDTINYIDSGKRVGSIIELFENFCTRRKLSGVTNQMTSQQYDEGYRKVRKIVLTPTRVIPIVPETIMGNRALSQGDHDGTRIIRVSFRDDCNQHLRRIMLGEQLLRETVLGYLSRGICIAGRKYAYLGSSNSQMRDNGAYFMERFSAHDENAYKARGMRIPDNYIPKIIKFRKKLGRFEDIESIPKVMARLGQCFTQARTCPSVELCRSDYQITFDIHGGKNGKREPYMFTDGIGGISETLATSLAKNMSFGKNCVPSAYQFRFRGFKGMVAIDPMLDLTANHFRKLYREGNFVPENLAIPDDTTLTPEQCHLKPWTYDACFRPSQMKFITTTKPCPIELVKYSSPCVVALNRPLINVMDHVSESQSRACHRRICERIEGLLDEQLLSFLKCMNDEDACRLKLQEMPRRIHFASLKKMSGFALSTEPFFRSLVRAAVGVQLNRLLRKTQIQIPPHLGRSMFGVTDETGRLQYGQVFVQYTANINDKTPCATSKRNIRTGKVLLTKCPSVVSGDVRIFEAVDIPELHHLNDVVVFPQHGPRSNPDEMAGSDLDGDEYTVIWDEELLFEQNEPAFNYTSNKIIKEFDINNMDPLMHEFFVEYILQDSVGAISLNHLYQSDQFGLESEVCHRLATKLTKALDYAKSGDPPAQLTIKWERDAENPKIVYAPERSERIPDFSASPDKILAMYTSSRLIGKLFRELKSLDDVLKLTEGFDIESVEIDAMIDFPGWEKYKEKARRDMERYNEQVKSIMNNYGIKTEAEIFSGCIMNLRKRISDSEQDDMSFYNTERVIETQMSSIFRTFREEFFNEFALNPDAPEAYMSVTEQENWKFGKSEDVLRRVCLAPSIQMKQKAVAYYKVCYQTCIDCADKSMLSFGWIAYDVLNDVRSKHIVECDSYEIKPVMQNPLHSMIEKNRLDFMFSNPNISIPEGPADRYLTHDLREVLLVLCNWAISSRVFAENEVWSTRKFGMTHFPMIFVQFAMQFVIHGKTMIENSDQSEEEYDDDEEEEELMTNQDKNEMTLGFFQYLSSRQFKRQKYLSFQSIGVSSIFMRGEWLALHKAAQQTYYKMLINLKLEDIPTSAIERNMMLNATRETNPFYVELPATENKKSIEKLLLNRSKCVEVHLRNVQCLGDNVKYLISARGTLSALQCLRELCMVRVPRHSWCLGEDLSKELSRSCYFKLSGKLS